MHHLARPLLQWLMAAVPRQNCQNPNCGALFHCLHFCNFIIFEVLTFPKQSSSHAARRCRRQYQGQAFAHAKLRE